MRTLVAVVASVALAALTVGGGGGAAARSPSHITANPKPPTRLWYRVTIRYSGTERLTGLSEIVKEKYESVYRRGVELHPQTAVLLRGPVPGASPVAFSVLRARPLLGRVTRWSWDYEADIPGCTHFERHRTARKLGQAQGWLAAEQAPPVDDVDVYVRIVDRDGLPSGPHGLVAGHTVIQPWFCNKQELVRAGVRHGVGPAAGAWGPVEFSEGCADKPDQGCFGLRKPRSIDVEPLYLNMRIPSCQNYARCFDGNRIRGVRFGTRHFERVARVHERMTLASPHGDNSIRTVDESWTYTFTRCPDPRPYEQPSLRPQLCS